MDREIVRQCIQREYERRGDTLGWRLLYSPWKTTKTATIAFIGLNPGGTLNEGNRPDLSCETGSAYEIERWVGYPPGEAPLQRQVRSVCRMMDQRCENVLAGNLVPFRSRSFRDLKDPKGAIRFGTSLWQDLIAEGTVNRLIVMGRPVQQAFLDLWDLNAIVETRSAGWGKQKIRVARTPSITIIGLPHLSRFRLMGHSESRSVINWALGS